MNIKLSIHWSIFKVCIHVWYRSDIHSKMLSVCVCSFFSSVRYSLPKGKRPMTSTGRYQHLQRVIELLKVMA